MLHISKILYATDFSPYSNQAYFHAVALAKNYRASLCIVHVLKPKPESEAAGHGGVERKHWWEQLKQIRPLDRDIPVEHTLLEGDAAEEIIHFATDVRADMIVLGTHGRSGVERLLMGSVAESVLLKAPCSVLIVKMIKRTDGGSPQ